MLHDRKLGVELPRLERAVARVLLQHNRASEQRIGRRVPKAYLCHQSPRARCCLTIKQNALCVDKDPGVIRPISK